MKIHLFSVMISERILFVIIKKLVYFVQISMKENNNKSHKEIALVLSGGGARGLAHVGVIRELEDQGFKIKSITGTSIGALVGGLYALGKLDEFENWMVKQKPYGFIRLMDISFRRNGILKGERILHKLRKEIPGIDIEKLDIPFQCIATDIHSQSSVVLNSGRIYEAIRASIAIPSIFTPVQKGEMLLVDGGVLDNIPVDFALKTSKSDVVLAVDVNARIPFNNNSRKHSPRKVSMFRLSNQVISLMTETIGDLKLKQTPPDFLIEVSRFSCELYEFYKAQKQIEYGRQCAREQLKNYTF